MTIEPTDEMERAYAAGTGSPNWKLPPGHRDGLAAVLAIVERDYRIEPKPPWERESAVGLCCIGYAPCQGRPGCNAATS